MCYKCVQYVFFSFLLFLSPRNPIVISAGTHRIGTCAMWCRAKPVLRIKAKEREKFDPALCSTECLIFCCQNKPNFEKNRPCFFSRASLIMFQKENCFSWITTNLYLFQWLIKRKMYETVWSKRCEGKKKIN